MRNGVRQKRANSGAGTIDLRQFVGGEQLSLDGGAGEVVSDLYAIAASSTLEGLGRDTESVDAFAQQLTRKISGLKADILQKAVQETIFDTAGLGYEPEKLDVRAGVEKFLRKRGTSRFLEIFLFRYVFNTVWIQIQEAVREKSEKASFARSMRRVEKLCISVVSSVIGEWQSEGKLQDLATEKRLGSILLKTIETRLLEH